MKNYTKKIFSAMMILMFGFLSIAVAQDKDSTSDVYTAFTLLETNIEINDYDSAWKLIAKPYQEEMFKGDIDNFKRYYSGKKNQQYEIKDVKFLSPEKAELTILRDNQQQVVLMVRENEEWKFTGDAKEIVKEIENAETQVDYSSPAVQAYLARENAFKNRDYVTAWEVTSESVRQNRWKGNLESFKENYSQIPDKLTNKYTDIKQARSVNPEEVEIEISDGEIFVMRLESGKWYWAGNLHDLNRNQN